MVFKLISTLTGVISKNGARRVTLVESETTTENPQTVKWAIPLGERKRP